ncbi:MAG: tetratricopeptide repeat protein [Candidatus Thorarchaeota archaeon]
MEKSTGNKRNTRELLKGTLCLIFGVLFSIPFFVFGVLQIMGLGITEGLGIIIGGPIVLGITIWFAISSFKDSKLPVQNQPVQSSKDLIFQESDQSTSSSQADEDFLVTMRYIQNSPFLHTDEIHPDFVQKYETHKVEYEAKVAIYEDTIKIQPQFTFPYLKLAELHREFGFFGKALQVYARATEVFGKTEEIALEVGLFYMDLRDIEGALELFEQILESNPTSWKALLQIGICYAMLGENKKAIEYTQCALKINQNNPDLLNNLGLFYYHDGQIEHSLTLLKQALSINPSHEGALRNYHMILNNNDAFAKEDMDGKKSLEE